MRISRIYARATFFLMMTKEGDHHQSRAFNELSALLFDILRSPSPDAISDESSLTLPAVASSRRPSQISSAGFASLLLGLSLALMLCGSVTFFIGFLLMPWVLALVFFLYVVGIVSNLSIIGRAVLCHAAVLFSQRKEMYDEAWKLM